MLHNGGMHEVGVQLDNILDWKCSTEAICKKGQSRLLLKEAKMFQFLNQDVAYIVSMFWKVQPALQPSVGAAE